MSEECIIGLYGGTTMYVAEPYDALRDRIETARTLEKNQGERRICPMVQVQLMMQPDDDGRWERHAQPCMIDPAMVTFIYRSPGLPS